MPSINKLEKLLVEEVTEVWMQAAIDIGRYSEKDEALRIINFYLQTPITYHMSRHIVCALAAYLSYHYQNGDLDESKITDKACLPVADSPKTLKSLNSATIPWIGKQLSKLVLYGLSIKDKPTIKVSYITNMPDNSYIKSEYKNIILYYSNAIAKKQELFETTSSDEAKSGLEKTLDKLNKTKKELENSGNNLCKALMNVRVSNTAWTLLDCKLEPWLMSSLLAGLSESYVYERFGISANDIIMAMVNIADNGLKPSRKKMPGDQRLAHIINLPKFLTNNYQPKGSKELVRARKILTDIQTPNYKHSSDHWIQFENSVSELT